MKVILTCGHPHSGYRMAHDILAAAGLAQANPSRREGMSAQAWHENVFNAYELDPSGCRFDAQINPGKLWQELAVDLFLGNLDQKEWGWAEARILPLLAFWKDFDPQVRFLLVYGAPEAAVGQMLKGRAVTPEDIEQAIASWTAYNTELLRFYNRNQGRCLLVNAAAVTHAPAGLVEKAASAFGLKLAESDTQESMEYSRACAVASSLAKALIADCTEAHVLYRELESAADANAESADATQADKRQAWQEYVELLARMTETVEQAQAQGERATLLEQDVEAVGRAHAEAQEQLTARKAREIELQSLLDAKEAEARQLKESGHALARLKQELDAQIALLKESQSTARERREAELNQLQGKNAELVKENELLLLQLHQVQEELEERFLQHQMLKKELSEVRLAFDQVHKQLKEQKVKVKEAQSAIAVSAQVLAQTRKQLQEQESKKKKTQGEVLSLSQTEIVRLQAKTDALSQENQILQLHLHEVQKELENCFFKSYERAIAERGEIDKKTMVTTAWVGHQPAEIVYDLRSEMAGRNWYYAEAGGRWAGPERVSTIRIPAMPGKRFEIELDVADAMSPEILRGMEMSVNGIQLQTSRESELYPARVWARVPSEAISNHQEWELQLMFPKLLSPMQVHRSDDERMLAIRVRRLILRAIK